MFDTYHGVFRRSVLTNAALDAVRSRIFASGANNVVQRELSASTREPARDCRTATAGPRRDAQRERVKRIRREKWHRDLIVRFSDISRSSAAAEKATSHPRG
jgi:hypothetical protein